MNKSNLKRYAPQARRDFIAAVTARANLLGLSIEGGELHAAPAETRNDIVLIAGRAWPVKVHGQRQRLIQRMRRLGAAQVIDAVAYAWFNRLAALRYMELHDYLGHGRRVLSNPAGGPPEVLAHALELAEQGDLPGLNVDTVRELKLGNRDAELYRQILIAQCNALHRAMPFLFEAIDDETELLLPDNLLHSDSIVAKLAAEIPEEDWAEVEAIGWLYQFYISEKKDQVIGKVVKSEDIPAATQLFTPNWIVQYLVQNSVGRLWLMANPGSTLASQWPYYIQPAEQTPEVQAQLDALIQTRIREDGEALNPETITVLDPACGSGHILVVAYDVLKAIYLERGYQPRAIPRLILEKNLYGLDIDDRAAQLASFALLMKARADDRRLFNEPPKLNVLSLQESKGLDADELARSLAPFGLQRAPLKALIDTFEHAKTFGSLIQIPAGLNGQLLAMTAGLQQALLHGDLYAQRAAVDVLPLVSQALVLGMQFDAVVANPPYMGGKGMNPQLKRLVEGKYRFAKGDLYTCFIAQNTRLSKANGIVAMITIPNWMFLSSFEELRNHLFEVASIETFSHNGRGVFGSDFGSCAFTVRKSSIADFQGRFKRLFEKQGSIATNDELQERFISSDFFQASIADFKKIPGSPIAYWVAESAIKCFSGRQVGDLTISDGQNKTGDNGRFVRLWWEVSHKCFGVGNKWLSYAKGGDFRRWFGNLDYVVDWSDAARSHYQKDFSARIIPEYLYYQIGVTWTLLTSAKQSFRLLPEYATFDMTGSSLFLRDVKDFNLLISFLNSCVADMYMKLLNPTLALQVRDVKNLPLPDGDVVLEVGSNAAELISIAKSDWMQNETSFKFAGLFPKNSNARENTLHRFMRDFAENTSRSIARMKYLEEENNRIFISAYGLQDELIPDVPEDQITLTRANRENDSQRLVSYAIGCMMGRYSLDEPGLIYAHAGNVGFDPSRYDKKFQADADGIVPITDEPWFADDAASRVREFLRAVWGAETLDQNMAWLAESLGVKGGEAPDDTIRRYLADKFFKDHLQTYKKRPIYWLFTSGKQGAFQALVYLHRYHPGTLARMRAEYVVPLTGKLQARIESVEKDIQSAASTAARTKLGKHRDTLRKQHLELLAYDEQLRHYADQRINLDLDDGVKVNYGKFGPLLAEVKAVTGGAGDDD